MRTSLVIPAFNEEEALPKVLEEARGAVNEIIVVDDGSRDKTAKIAEESGAILVQHKENNGKVAAIRSGVARAEGDIIILIDADFTYPTAHIPDMVAEIEKGADLVLGSRFMTGGRAMPFLNSIGNRLFSLAITYAGGTTITDGQTGYRAFRREMFDTLDVDAKGLEWETKMTVRAQKLGYTIIEVPIVYRERLGMSKLRPIADGYRMMEALASIFFKETSLLAGTIILPSIVLAIIGLLFGIMSVYEKFVYITLRHEYYPLISTLLLLFALQLFSMGFLLDYMIKRLDRIEERLKRS